MLKRRPTLDGVFAAADRIRGIVRETPLLASERQPNLWFKAESLQQGGSFKLRGATNRLVQLSAAERARGVVAFSSGNHAQGVAIAAARLGIRATIVMPADAPRVKRESTLAAGAEIRDYDRATQSREEIAAALAEERGSILVPSFDDVDVIEGQGSVGVEIGEQMRKIAGAAPDTILVPCGGGGLAAGIALALPNSNVITVEPEGWDDMARSLELGEILDVGEGAPQTACDSLLTRRVSPLTLSVLAERGARGVSVTDEEVAAAMALAMRQLRLVVEPGGAAALAAYLAGKAGADGGRTVVILSGGNVDPALYAAILKSQAAEITR